MAILLDVEVRAAEKERNITVEKVTDEALADVSAYLAASPKANYAQEPGWLEVIRKTYGKEILVFRHRTGDVTDGVAACAALIHPLFGRRLVALPYLDFGGIAADTEAAEAALLSRLLEEAQNRQAGLELRCRHPLREMPPPENEKVGMALSLEAWHQGAGRDGYWKKLDARVRNQVRKAEKSGVTCRWGKKEYLDDFYAVFCVNMRDLGSPVHPRAFFEAIIDHVPGVEVGAAYREGVCIGGLVRVAWRDEMIIPWASTLREFRVHCPNNALYWESLSTAFERGIKRVDFGRSSLGEGTHRFKKQWLAEEEPLNWYQFDNQGRLLDKIGHASSGKMELAAKAWTHLPVGWANALGPRIRGHFAA